MAIAVFERFGSRQITTGENPTVELLYSIDGTDDDQVAKAELLKASPVLYSGLVRQSVRLEPVAPLTWEGSVRYGRRQPMETGQSSFQFETGGGTQHITQSLGTIGAYAPTGLSAPNFHGAIGVAGDDVQGVDIVVPVYAFSETHYIAAAAVTGAYKATLFALTGKVNAAPFRGFAAGEVRFDGASGAKRGEEDWEITFRFAASPNAAGLTIGEITGINKAGWDYLWVLYESAEDAVAKALVKKPIAVYVERVYSPGDFTLLGIGS